MGLLDSASRLESSELKQRVGLHCRIRSTLPHTKVDFALPTMCQVTLGASCTSYFTVSYKVYLEDVQGRSCFTFIQFIYPQLP